MYVDIHTVIASIHVRFVLETLLTAFCNIYTYVCIYVRMYVLYAHARLGAGPNNHICPN